jgi:UDP-N-acetylglucosamine--N-acetylmuramyl-(pentapeptide) pyrophosphoryl-undecaprenol N-acetylglucosamine transferase
VPRILYGVSPIGLGHATRSLVLSQELERSGAEIRFFSGGKAAEFIRDRGFKVDDIVEDPVPHVSNGEMSRVALWYLRSWIANRRTVPRTLRLLDDFSPDLVVCDEEFSGIVAAGKRSVKRVFIADELVLGFARSWLSREIEGRMDKWYKGLQDSVDLLVVPELGESGGNRRFVGPIVRSPTKSPTETKSAYGLPEGGMVLFATSGSGLGRELAFQVRDAIAIAGLPGVSLVVTGNRGPKIGGKAVYDLGVVPDNQNLVAAADLVVSTAGKSTIDEAAAAGTPIIVIPIRHHAEQERNAAALGYTGADVARLPELVHKLFGMRRPPKRFSGEVEACRAILSLDGGGREGCLGAHP